MTTQVNFDSIGGGAENFVSGEITTADWTGTGTSDTCSVALGFKPKSVHVWSTKTGNVSSSCQWGYAEDIPNYIYGTQQNGVKISVTPLGGGDYYGQIYSIDDVGSAINPAGGFTLKRYSSDFCSQMKYVAEK